ncbi:uncharacterized protein DS421_10g303500 [Arachis hypogaea]|nr:uncharacterized protein DS421_10g303500 [Arachis hypogaea]
MALTNAFTQKVDRVADINATKLAWNLVVRVVRLYEIPSSWNPTDVCSLELVLQDEMGDRIHCSIPKANVVVFKTVVREFGIYSMRNFIVQPNSKAVDVVNLNILLDCVGHIVGKEDVRPMVTKSGQESKCMTLYLEDLEKNKIKCIIFGEMIGKLTPFINKDDGEPLILVAQLFKPNQYLNQINIQNSLYASRVFLNPDFPDVVAFKNRYRLNVVVTDGTGCINIMLWNQEAKIILGKSANDIMDLMKDADENACLKAFEPIIDRKFLFKLSISQKNLTSVDQAYNAVKISDDEVLIDLYSSHSSSIDIGGVEQGLSNVVCTTGNNDLDLDGNGVAIVSLSKDSGIESIFESGLDTPGKCVIADSAPSLGVSGLTNPEGQGSSNKTFKRGSTKRKIE